MKNFITRRTLLLASLYAICVPSIAGPSNPDISLIFNGLYSHRDDTSSIGDWPTSEHGEAPAQGFGIGHSELLISGNIDDGFYGQTSLAFDLHDGELELELEEMFIDAYALPYGFGLRGGRFLSNIGYLNNHHTHTDSFTTRPMVYRAFLNNHYYDDGVRINWVAPTNVYIEFGAEAFSGRNAPLVYGETENTNSIGSYTAFAKFGGDIGENHNWLVGLSYLGAESEACEEAHEEEEEDHAHSAGACNFKGKHQYIIADATWKWSPSGEMSNNGLTLRSEYIHYTQDGDFYEETEIDAFKGSSSGAYLTAVYRFTKRWEAGLRANYMDVDVFTHEEDTTDETPYLKPKAFDAMVQFNHSEFAKIRLQYTNDQGQHDKTDHQVYLQYVMELGAHGAHQF